MNGTAGNQDGYLEDATAFLRGFLQPPQGVTASYGTAHSAADALLQKEVVCVLKLRGQSQPGVLMMLSGDRQTALAFAKSCKRYYTLITDPKGV